MWSKRRSTTAASTDTPQRRPFGRSTLRAVRNAPTRFLMVQDRRKAAAGRGAPRRDRWLPHDDPASDAGDAAAQLQALAQNVPKTADRSHPREGALNWLGVAPLSSVRSRRRCRSHPRGRLPVSWGYEIRDPSERCSPLVHVVGSPTRARLRGPVPVGNAKVRHDPCGFEGPHPATTRHRMSGRASQTTRHRSGSPFNVADGYGDVANPSSTADRIEKTLKQGGRPRPRGRSPLQMPAAAPTRSRDR